MAPSWQGRAMVKRQCVHCGQFVTGPRPMCPYCRELLPEIPKPVMEVRPTGGKEVRRGLLYMLVALVVHYFAGGYSAMNLPIHISPVVFEILSPLLFLGGLGLMLYGVYLGIRS